MLAKAGNRQVDAAQVPSLPIQQSYVNASAIVRPMMTYGALVWAHRIGKVHRKGLEQVQRMCLLAMPHPMRSTPTKGMEAIV